MNRGGRYMSIFEDNKDYSTFLDLLQETIETFHIKIGAFCLMGNHYHLLIQTPEANISRSRGILMVFTLKGIINFMDMMALFSEGDINQY